MNILIKSATIIDASSKYHLQKMDILIKNGKIEKIAATINAGDVKELHLKNLYVSQGWFDSSVSFGEPGFEERENIENGLETAAMSGFTHIALNASTNPVTQSKSQIKYILSKAEGKPVSLHPIGALSVNSEGLDLAELYDMQNAGAVAYYDYKKPVSNTNLLKIGLQYCQNFNGLIQSFPFDRSIAKNGMVNEEVNSTKLGLKGIPALAEELQISRDLYLLEYTGGKLHIPTISTKKSVRLIKEAKKKGLDISCSVSINNLMLTDDALQGFNSNYKLMPPLRTKEDNKALLKGLLDGTIDGVTSDHDPIDIENKKTEFDNAKFGSIGLESIFGALNSLMEIEKSIAILNNLKERFQVPINSISEGNPADITLFTTSEDYIFSKKDILSTSKNAALLGKKLKGKVYGVIANNKMNLKNNEGRIFCQV